MLSLNKKIRYSRMGINQVSDRLAFLMGRLAALQQQGFNTERNPMQEEVKYLQTVLENMRRKT